MNWMDGPVERLDTPFVPRYADIAGEGTTKKSTPGDDFGRWRRFFPLTKHFIPSFFGRIQVLLSQKIVSIVQNRLHRLLQSNSPRSVSISSNLLCIFVHYFFSFFFLQTAQPFAIPTLAFHSASTLSDSMIHTNQLYL